MLVRLMAAARHRRTIQMFSVLAMGAVALAAVGVLNVETTEAAKGGNGNCQACRQEPIAPVFIAQTPPTAATVGVAYSYQFQASGNPTPTYALASGALPFGLTLNSTTGLLAGTPTTGGSFSFQVAASNSAGSALTSWITMTVSSSSCTVPSWGAIKTSHSLTAGAWYSYTFAASGSPTPSYSLRSGSIPAGMNLSSTGVVSGTPTTAATYSFTLYARNSCGTVGSPTITMTVAAAQTTLSIQAFAQPMIVTYGRAVNYQFVATGGTPPYRFYQSGGTMPAGLSLSAEGVLSGTVLAWPGQDFVWYLSVVDARLGLYGTAVWMRIQ